MIGADRAVIDAGERFRTVLVVWGNLDVHGETEEIVLLSGRVTFHPGARVSKSLVVVGGNFEAKPGADVAGERVVFQAPGPIWSLLRTAGSLWREYYEGVVRWLMAASFCLVTWLLGLLCFGMFPALQRNTADRLGLEWGKNLAAGLLAALLVPALFVLLVLSVVGIFALPLFVLFLGAGAFLAYASAGLWAGHRLLPPKPGTRINAWGFLLGLAAIQFLWNSGIFIATLPALALWLLGWGVVVRGLRALWR